MQSAVGYNMHYDYSHYADTCTAAAAAVVVVVGGGGGGAAAAAAVDICRDYVHYMHCVHTCYTPGGSY